MIKEITSKTNRLVKYFNKLKDTSFMKEEKKFLIEGMHLIEMAKDYLECVISEKPLKNDYNITNYIVSKEIMEKLSSHKSTSKVIGVGRFIEEKPINSDFLIYLDDVQDPGNFGTIVRSALAFGIKDVLISTNNVFQYNSKFIQSSQGAIFKSNIIRVESNVLKELQSKGYQVIVSTLEDGAIDLSCYEQTSKKIVLVLGNEGNGVCKEITKLSDLKVKIEMNNIDSLNVAVAAGILMYTLNK